MALRTFRPSKSGAAVKVAHPISIILLTTVMILLHILLHCVLRQSIQNQLPVDLHLAGQQGHDALVEQPADGADLTNIQIPLLAVHEEDAALGSTRGAPAGRRPIGRRSCGPRRAASSVC
ncbi:hypothetical protein PG997_008872 [Apiospora hydei]|uniref:Uncharacterized protein n=1 Tax=Apiospora hydei TaxID=1337664 RepID=A0ABR1WC14_9PEZI